MTPLSLEHTFEVNAKFTRLCRSEPQCLWMESGRDLTPIHRKPHRHHPPATKMTTMSNGGRDQRGPMERLVRCAALLHHAGRVGVPGEELAEAAGFKETADPGSALAREFRHLNALGWKIENIAPQGTAARYRMTNVDNRLKLRLTPEQQTALRRAVLLVDRDDLADHLDLAPENAPQELTAVIDAGTHDGTLGVVINALRHNATQTFRYNGTTRTVNPDSVRTQQTHWYLRGREGDSDVVKAFVVSRMSEVRADAPGTATSHPTPKHTRLHPMSWEIDPPVDVTLAARTEYVADVLRWLGSPVSTVEGDEETELTYTVTHRAALRVRIYQLGTRVRIVGPAEIRDEIIGELERMAMI